MSTGTVCCAVASAGPTTDRTPFDERWGGWALKTITATATGNTTDLSARFDVAIATSGRAWPLTEPTRR